MSDHENEDWYLNEYDPKPKAHVAKAANDMVEIVVVVPRETFDKLKHDASWDGFSHVGLWLIERAIKGPRRGC